MKSNTTKFTIEVEMRDRWVPHFLGMLKEMQRLGGAGCSRMISFYSDGDGDYNPIFKWDSSLPEPIKGLDPLEVGMREPFQGDTFFDAG